MVRRELSVKISQATAFSKIIYKIFQRREKQRIVEKNLKIRKLDLQGNFRENLKKSRAQMKRHMLGKKKKLY